MVTKITVMLKLFVSFLCFYCMAGAAVAVPAVVDYVLDGDTFAAKVMLEDGIKITVRVRLSDVDTPELNGLCDEEIAAANKAKNRVAELLPSGTIVELSEITDDKYLGRIDAKVILPDGRDLSEILISENLGRHYDGGKRQGWCK